MIIAIPKETAPHETRVAATPETIKSYASKGHHILVETTAGENAGFSDKSFSEAGATIASQTEIYKKAEVILKIRAPLSHEIPLLQKEQILIADFSQATLKDLAYKKLTCFALERIPRISRAQNMDILSSQSNLAGYKAVINAAQLLKKSFPLLMTAAGTLAPAKVLILGLGVAGLQAAATAKRLGALVFASDIREETKEQASSLGAKFLNNDEIPEQLPKTDILITTAQTLGKAAPKLISKTMLQTMPTGAVIIDMASATGGNVEGSKDSQTIHKNGKILIGNSNLACELADSASFLFARNIRSFFELITAQPEIDFTDEILKATCIIHNGKSMFQGE